MILSLLLTKLAEKEIDFEGYRKDLLIKRTVERNLEIIGEAMYRIIRLEPDVSIENAHRIVGLRNQIIHGYDSVSDEIIWGILKKHLQELEITVIKMIDSGE